MISQGRKEIYPCTRRIGSTVLRACRNPYQGAFCQWKKKKKRAEESRKRVLIERRSTALFFPAEKKGKVRCAEPGPEKVGQNGKTPKMELAEGWAGLKRKSS